MVGHSEYLSFKEVKWGGVLCSFLERESLLESRCLDTVFYLFLVSLLRLVGSKSDYCLVSCGLCALLCL